jgi:hypothetical protein
MNLGLPGLAEPPEASYERAVRAPLARGHRSHWSLLRFNGRSGSCGRLTTTSAGHEEINRGEGVAVRISLW